MWWCSVLWCAVLRGWCSVLGLAVAAAVLRRRAAVASAVHRLWRAVPSSYVAGCRRLARGSRRVASAARLLSLSATEPLRTRTVVSLWVQGSSCRL